MANQRSKEKAYISGWINKKLKQRLEAIAKKRSAAEGRVVPVSEIITEILEEQVMPATPQESTGRLILPVDARTPEVSLPSAQMRGRLADAALAAVKKHTKPKTAASPGK